nr:hypothetical protein CFP56_63471 [Quercus suber]
MRRSWCTSLRGRYRHAARVPRGRPLSVAETSALERTAGRPAWTLWLDHSTFHPVRVPGETLIPQLSPFQHIAPLLIPQIAGRRTTKRGYNGGRLGTIPTLTHVGDLIGGV